MKDLTLSEMQVIQAIWKSGLLSQDKLASAYSVSQATISRICNPLSGESLLKKAQEVSRHIQRIKQKDKQ